MTEREREGGVLCGIWLGCTVVARLEVGRSGGSTGSREERQTEREEMIEENEKDENEEEEGSVFRLKSNSICIDNRRIYIEKMSSHLSEILCRRK